MRTLPAPPHSVLDTAAEATFNLLTTNRDRHVLPLTSIPAGPLAGDIAIPGDKSISHRALIIATLAVGRSVIRGLLEGDDVLGTVSAMRTLGARISRQDDATWIVDGVGVGGLAEPDDLLDMGNSGTGARLLLGVLASHSLSAFVTGDASLRQRPMDRVIEPLSRIGARFITRDNGRLPLAVHGTDEPLPITYRPSVASAQVKSAVLLAGLNSPGTTTVIEAQATRDHTERMLQHFGADIRVTENDNGREIALTGQPELQAAEVDIPGDFSSAAFPLVAALITPGSELTLRNIGVNPERTGLLTTLLEMGAAIEFSNERMLAGEPVADLTVLSSALHGVEVPAIRAPSMIDEFPVLAIAAARADGTSIMHGLAELKVKESDRLTATAEGLACCGVTAEAGEDTLKIQGIGSNTQTGGHVRSQFDHRIAMSFLVHGISAATPVTVDDGAAIATSFPDFMDLMNGIGAKIGGANTQQTPDDSSSERNS